MSHDAVLVGKAADKVTVGLKRKSSAHLNKEDMYGMCKELLGMCE